MTIAMPAMTAKAANRLPLTPKPLRLNFDRNAICPLPRLRYLGMFLARQYRDTRLTSLEKRDFFRHNFLLHRFVAADFFREPENAGRKAKIKKAGV
ncbi:hypothetical protein [Bradyrhizobium valentinum]|uniref:hypothetical protein n=1 Tax=Bradyrhizobium valentinum TaxID=1518501 RepID=UPI0018D269C5|nr:hypothetical protein [Bradyrhizobium valentinum]